MDYGIVLVVITAIFIAQGHPGGKTVHQHSGKKSTIQKLQSNIHSVEDLVSKQEKRLQTWFTYLNKKTNAIKRIAAKAENEYRKNSNISSRLTKCAKLSCQNGGKCIKVSGGFKCMCTEGYYGKSCQKKNELVVKSKCDATRESDCICPAGYQIDLDQENCFDIDECLQMEVVFETEIVVIPDDIGSFSKRGINDRSCRFQCVNTPGSYRCVCPPGFTSDPERECRDVDECETGTHSCSSGRQECFNTAGGYKCIEVACPDHYYLDSPFICRRQKCAKSDRKCLRRPTSYMYKHIELPSNVQYPVTVFQAPTTNHSGLINQFSILPGDNSKKFKSQKLTRQTAELLLLRSSNQLKPITVEYQMREKDAATRKLVAKYIYHFTIFHSTFEFQ